MRRSLKSRRNGSKTKLNSLQSRSINKVSTEIMMTCLLKNQSLIRRSWDSTMKSNSITRRSENLRLLSRIKHLRWTSWMICSTATQILKISLQMTTTILRKSSCKSLKNWKTNLSDSRWRLHTSKTKKDTFLVRLWKLNVKFFFGSVKSNLKKRCKMLLTQPSDRQKLLQWEKRSTECSYNMNSSVKNRRSSLRIWRDLSLREKLSNSNIYPKLKRRMLRIDHHKANCPDKLLTWSKHWDTQQKTPCSLTLPSSREGEKSIMWVTISMERKNRMKVSRMSFVWVRSTFWIGRLKEQNSLTRIRRWKISLQDTIKWQLTSSRLSQM